MPIQKEQPPKAHAFSDTTKRFAVDALLRDSGFRIWARPAGAPAVWERWGELFTEDEARETLFPGDLETALRDEHNYYTRACR